MRFARAAAFSVLLGLVFTPGVGLADYAKDSNSGFDVTQYLTVAYDFKYCGDGNDYAGYKMHTVSRRWYRSNLRRDVSRAHGRWGAYALTCAHDLYKRNHEFDFDPCFGCDGYTKRWTPDFQGSTGYPYLIETDCPDCAEEGVPEWKLGVHIRGYVVGSNGRRLGTLCTKVQLIGTNACFTP